MAHRGKSIRLALLALAGLIAPGLGLALDRVDFDLRGGDKALAGALRNASLLGGLETNGQSDPRDVLSAALADYGRLLDALYAAGHYGGVINILIDGKEAAGIAAFAVPDRISRVTVRVEPGPQFRFNTARVAPLPRESRPVAGFERGAPARSTTIRSAVEAGVSDWRDAGHAKADVAGQRLVANHPNATLDADIRLAPGPLVRFGALRQTNPSAVRAERIARIAGLPTGETFSPDTLDRVANRLRRTGAFASVALSEADDLGPGDSMDIDLALADQKPRRFGFGAEISSLEGATLSGFWLHRNLFGGAERFRVDAEVSGIDGTIAGMDASLSARLDVPAAFGTDTDAFVFASVAYQDEPAYRLLQGGGTVGVHRYFTDRLEGEIGAAYRYTITDDDLGTRRFSMVSLPAELTWDGRNDALDPSRGAFINAEVEPFHDLEGGAWGARGWLDARAYRGFGDDDRFVFAGRALVGSVVGAGAAAVPPDYLFFSGGGGSVRGFPYQSLGIDLGGGTIVGGRAFLGLSGELRYRVSETFGAAAFVDAGHLGADKFFDASSNWQVGAGVGLRYYTGIGPVRLDVALPVSGPGGAGVQFYVGIGQSF
ncbi:autotransporter assembly complex protein TamA [Sinisalibacter lacisalsi]|uniref:Outer membrane protein assembly factor n=1 Tax=Sinisalibacter lacisalsi TaxID=1526570 RepID=A0ABQ1QNX5_9RHOB|nr:autotransporter assembly complex family protein [Sinisalibacter lacisalsi]GGD36193.1 outer membrane protein assembly factor [Sinisalibacter lacisalsi]